MSGIKRPLSKFKTVPNKGIRFNWWLAQKDKQWSEDAPPIPDNLKPQ